MRLSLAGSIATDEIEGWANQFLYETENAKRLPVQPRNFRIAFRTFIGI